MSQTLSLNGVVLDSLEQAELQSHPFRHWILRDVLPSDVRRAILRLPIDPPRAGDSAGKRETLNSMRTFFSRDNCRDYPVCREVAATFQDQATVTRLEQMCGVDLQNTYLRIEFCQDTDGFWLEPHTDIGAKAFSMLLYLTDCPSDEQWGTDLFDGDQQFVKSVPFQVNQALLFVPAADTWHGFRRRPINGVRRSLIINYVISEWRSRHELAFPETPVYTDRPLRLTA